MGSLSVYAWRAPARYEIRIVGVSEKGATEVQTMVCWTCESASTDESGRLFVSIFRFGEDLLSSVVVNEPIGNDALFMK